MTAWPVVGPDGTVYVFFRNQDTPAENQFLMVKSTDGGVSFGDPVKVADDFDVNYPTGRTTRPDCVARGQGSTRRVLANSCFRVNSYGGPAVAPDGTLYLGNNFVNGASALPGNRVWCSRISSSPGSPATRSPRRTAGRSASSLRPGSPRSSNSSPIHAPSSSS